MKQFRKKYLIFLFLIIFSASYSKDFFTGVNIPSLFLLNFSFFEEYTLNDNLSIQLNVGLRPNLYHVNKESLYFNFKGIFVTPALRYYVKGHSNKSFFIGPYVRIAKYATGFYYVGEDSWSGLTHELYTGFSIDEAGGGFDFGMRFFASKKIAIDLFLGPRISKINYEHRWYHFPNSTGRSGIYEFEDFFSNSIQLFDKVYYETTEYYDKITASNIIPALRTGFTINYLFESKKKKEEETKIPEYYINEEY